MSLWFLISVAGVLILTPVHFLSIEHDRLEDKYGKDKGKRIGGLLGIISGWGYFLFLFGIWLSPQPTYILPFQEDSITVIFEWLSVSPASILFGCIFLLPGIWFGIKGVMDLGLEVSETHRAEQIVEKGVYARVRHPQYLGALLSHIGISLMLSALYAVLVTPIIIIRDFVVCKKEEKELAREFGNVYLTYKDRVPMLIPSIWSNKEELMQEAGESEVDRSQQE